MIPCGDLPGKIPLFPLPGALLLPRARLPLQIFEPRYLAMLDAVLKTPERLIGMIQTRHGANGKETLARIGCAGRVVSFSETDDGRYVISLLGISRFTLGSALAGFAPYLTGEVNWDGFDRDRAAGEVDPSLDRTRFIKLLSRYFASQKLDTDWDSLKAADDEMLINSLSMLCPFEPEEKQALLEAQTLSGRREILLTLMEFNLRGGADEVVQ
ncbi:MAG: LON peptidase substrate-binding domain-containing protein [Rhodobacteraceae bacterium]|nr:LON peptidase substrate-binding domain-containing protein [Paracoccaceae bacterium]